jgi:3D (Asp-Asp-Asp) domain-containing protein
MDVKRNVAEMQSGVKRRKISILKLIQAVAILILVIVLTVINIQIANAATGYLTVSGELMDVRTYAGDFTVTTYCPCRKCNGKWTGQPTASGAPMLVGTTVAVDPSVIPLGTELRLEINGESFYRTAQDTGNKVKGNKIDLLIDDCSSLTTYYDVKVWILEEEDEVMPIVLKLKDGKTETLLADRDFIKLVNEYMGSDAAQYFSDICEELEDLRDED